MQQDVLARLQGPLNQAAVSGIISIKKDGVDLMVGQQLLRIKHCLHNCVLSSKGNGLREAFASHSRNVAATTLQCSCDLSST